MLLALACIAAGALLLAEVADQVVDGEKASEQTHQCTKRFW